jgi:hypothetical protein
MFERGKPVTSSLRAAAIVAGEVILAPFCTFSDSASAPAAIPFTVTQGPRRFCSREEPRVSLFSRSRISAQSDRCP